MAQLTHTDEEYLEAVDEFVEAARMLSAADKRRIKAQAQLCDFMFQRNKTTKIHRQGILIVKDKKYERHGALTTEKVDNVE